MFSHFLIRGEAFAIEAAYLVVEASIVDEPLLFLGRFALVVVDRKVDEVKTLMFSVWFLEFGYWNLFGNWIVEIALPGSAGVLHSTG